MTNPVEGGNIPLLQSVQITRGMSVAALGDSIVVRNNGIDLSTATQAATFVQPKGYTTSSFLLHGALRSQNAWFGFEYCPGFSGANAAGILANSLPALLAFSGTYNKPDMCAILAGTNDANSGSTTPIPSVIASLKSIATALANINITPIFCSIPPKTIGDPAYIANLNAAIARLAYTFTLGGVPFANFYEQLVGPTGAWANASDTVDGTHPSPQGYAKMGYALYLALLGWTKPSRIIVPLWATGSSFLLATDPNFQTLTGTVNTASSYPTAWSAPTTLTMSTVFNSSGTELGTGHTMYSGTYGAQINGMANTPNYIGNSWSFKGNGTNTVQSGSNNLSTGVLGHRMAVRFRVKMISDFAAASPIDPYFGIYDSGVNVGAMWAGFTTYGANFQAINIGNETNYIAGDAYFEFTNLAAFPNLLAGFYRLRNGTGTSSNANDSLTIANPVMIDMTAAGIAAP